MFSGTTIEDLLAMVERVEANAETRSILHEQLEKAPLFFLTAYEPVLSRTAMGVA